MKPVYELETTYTLINTTSCPRHGLHAKQFDGLIYEVILKKITSPEDGCEVLWLSPVLLLSFNNMISMLSTAINSQSFLKETNLPLPQGSFMTGWRQCNLNVKTMPSVFFHSGDQIICFRVTINSLSSGMTRSLNQIVTELKQYF